MPVRFKREKLIHTESNIIESSSYKCSSCDKSFRREAALKRHIEFDHRKVYDSDDEDMVVDETMDDGAQEDDSEEYKQPNLRSPHHSEPEEVPQSAPVAVEVEPDRPYSCDQCAHRFKEVAFYSDNTLLFIYLPR